MSEFCVDTSTGHECRLRYTRIEIVSPDAGTLFNATTAGTVPVVAHLVADPANDGGGFATVTAGQAAMAGTLPNFSGQLAFTGERDVTINVEATLGSHSLDASVVVRIDTIAPMVTLVPEAAPARAAGDGGLLDVDSSTGFVNAYKKDEVAELRVEASEPVQVTAADFAPLESAVSSRTSCTSMCPLGKTCTCFNLDLAKVPLTGMRGNPMVPLARVRDLAGNLSTGGSSTTVAVTRLKWKRTVAPVGYSPTTPAVSSNGVVFVGTYATIDGRLVAVAPNGQALNSFDAGVNGAVSAGPLVSGNSVYVATRDTAGKIRKFDTATGSLLGEECSSTTYTFNSPLALNDIGQAPEAVLAVSATGALAAARVGASTGLPCAVASLGTTTQKYALVATDSQVFAANGQSAVLSRVPWTSATQQWGSPTTNSLGAAPENLVAFGSTVGGATSNFNVAGLFALKADAGFAQRADFTTSALGTQPGGAASVGGTLASPTFFVGNNSPALVRVDYSPGDPGSFDGGTSAATPPSQAVSLAPVVGDSEIYVLGLSGALSVYSPGTLAQLWSASGVTAAPGATQLNLDVARNAMGFKDCGRGGVLYITASDGMLTAVIVDSNGVKGDAPWPRWQHDPAATGNPATSLTPWSCP